MAALRSSLDAFWTTELEDLVSSRPATNTDTSVETKGRLDDD